MSYIPHHRIMAIACLVACLAPTAVAAQSNEAIGDLVFTAEGLRPVRVRIVVQRDGVPLIETHDELRAAYFQGLLDQLDSDGDGLVNKTEGTRLPTPPPPLSVLMRERADDIHVAGGSVEVADKNDDDMVDVIELENYYDTHEESLVRLMTVAAGTGVDPLFTRLDEDRNRRLTEEEWQAIFNLMQFDRDGNRLLTTDEVARPAASTIRENYATPSGGPTSLVCSFDEPNGPADLIAMIHQTTNGGDLTQTELSFSTPSNPAIELLPVAIGEDGVVGGSFRFEGHLVQLQILPPAIRGVEQTQETLLREFFASDLDEDGSVPNSTEVPEFLQETFGLLDHDGSGEVSAEEIDAYLAGLLLTRARLESTKMIMFIHEETRGIFAMLDRNGDGRLSLRERESAGQWSEMAGRAEELRAGDIPRSIQIVLRPGSLPSPYNSTGSNDLGPPWFYRMDRNRDGDLDISEFLGESKLFTEMDANGDSLVSAGEAIAADREMRTE